MGAHKIIFPGDHSEMCQVTEQRGREREDRIGLRKRLGNRLGTGLGKRAIGMNTI